MTKMRYRKDRLFRREYAARKLQARFRAFITRKKYISKSILSGYDYVHIGIKRAFMKCQANVLTRQCRRAYLKMRSDILVAQQYIKRYHAMLWYKRIKESKEGLETHIE